MQATAMQIIYKGVFQWFLKLIVGFSSPIAASLKRKSNSLSLPTITATGHPKPVGFPARRSFVESQTRSSRRLFRENPLSGFHQQLFHQYAFNQKKRGKNSEHDPIRKMLEAIDAGYSLILFPEGTRGKPEQMGKNKIRHCPYPVAAA